VKNGLVPVEVPEEIHRALLEHPGWVVTVDLERRLLVLPDGRKSRFPSTVSPALSFTESIPGLREQETPSSLTKLPGLQPIHV
jgi:hypothetical protein